MMRTMCVLYRAGNGPRLDGRGVPRQTGRRGIDWERPRRAVNGRAASGGGRNAAALDRLFHAGRRRDPVNQPAPRCRPGHALRYARVLTTWWARHRGRARRRGCIHWSCAAPNHLWAVPSGSACRATAGSGGRRPRAWCLSAVYQRATEELLSGHGAGTSALCLQLGRRSLTTTMISGFVAADGRTNLGRVGRPPRHCLHHTGGAAAAVNTPN
jgi:hypothetical protein